MKIDLNKYKAFFFDFDGVIVDSLDVKTEAFGELFSKYGKDISRKVIDYHCKNGGISRYEKFRYYYKNFLNKKIGQKTINRLDEDFSKTVVKKVAVVPFIKGALDLIRLLNKNEKYCFIISATPQKEMRRIAKLRNIDLLFKSIVGSPGNKCDNLKYLLAKYSIDPAQAVYFGDARSDYEAATANNVDFLGIVNAKSRELAGIKGIKKIKNLLLNQ